MYSEESSQILSSAGLSADTNSKASVNQWPMHQGEWEDLRIYSHGTQFWALWISELASKVVRASCCDLDRRGGSHCWCFVPINGQHGKILFGQETNIMPFSIIQTRTYKKDGKLLINHQNNAATFSQLTLSSKNLHLPYTLNTCDLNYGKIIE